MTLQVNRNITGTYYHIPRNRVELLTLKGPYNFDCQLYHGALQMEMEIAEKQIKASWRMLLTQREMKIPHKHPV